jgi:hypothetical protein
LTTPAARQRFARDLVAKSAPRDDLADPRDTLSAFDRGIVGSASVRLRIPLGDTATAERNLAMTEEACRVLRLQLEQRGTDRTHLFTCRGVMRLLHQRMNAYRAPRKDAPRQPSGAAGS